MMKCENCRYMELVFYSDIVCAGVGGELIKYCNKHNEICDLVINEYMKIEDCFKSKCEILVEIRTVGEKHTKYIECDGVIKDGFDIVFLRDDKLKNISFMQDCVLEMRIKPNREVIK